MIFFLAAFFGMYIGRKVGWSVSRAVLYSGPAALVVILCFVWGGVIAVLVYGLIQWQQPGLLLKIIMGYALGAYVSIPNFGLLNKATIPDFAKARHSLISVLPLLTYIGLTAALGFGVLRLQSQNPVNEASLFQNWSPLDKANSKHFILSIQADLESIRLSNERTSSVLPETTREQILELKRTALAEAHSVTDDVLDKIHPELRQNFRDPYQTGLELRLQNLEAKGRNPEAEKQGLALHDKWADWFNANRDRINVPK